MDYDVADQKQVAATDQELNAELYKALLNDDGKEVKRLCETLPDRAMHILTIHKDTVLHKATYSKQECLALDLLQALRPDQDDLENMTRQNNSGNTILHEAATLDKAQVAKMMLEKAPDLLKMKNDLGETALFRAARYGKTECFKFLAGKISETNEEEEIFTKRKDMTTILHTAILSQHFDLALQIAREFKHLIKEKDEAGMTALQHLSCNPSAFETLRKRGFLHRFSKFVKMYCSWGARGDKVLEEGDEHSALELARILVKQDTSWVSTSSVTDVNKPTLYKKSSTTQSNVSSRDKGSDQGLGGLVSSKSVPEEYFQYLEMGGGERLVQDCNSVQQEKEGGITPLFIATKSGCVEIVREILKTYPQAVEHIDKLGRTILHVAIKYRQLEIFKLVLEMEVPMRWLVRRLDNKENSILHMVGKKRADYVPEKLRGPALELQEELIWFERVKLVTKAHFIDHRNNMNETAEGLFASANGDLRNSAREWLKHTSEGCSIVAVLIATVAFAAAYTIPGGPNQNTGFPVLLYQPFFVVFTATDVLSLACALTSVVIFLSILTAPFRLDDFRQSLPNKLMVGFTFLFLSVSMMMIAFAATIILMIRSNERWQKVLLYSLSFLPVAIFALSYLPLYLSLSRTYKYLFKKIMQVIPFSNQFRAHMSKCSNLLISHRENQISNHASNRLRLQNTNPNKHMLEREGFYSLDAPQSSHSSV
ncbi:protein ACCELERATED CELL DEATH 6-like [Juglans microcarpa x Juglans regia]|uniref:protein ACCELERATED CELL DEATH 6-like n=1 Tax=Juglans microcarpa x Juglans regia TaxID=2249226 RepID=UPI001B7F4223|nr:protein ACCELERATED CELL DEATH 6-like [Juglans microcarpa x Juglans regia]